MDLLLVEWVSQLYKLSYAQPLITFRKQRSWDANRSMSLHAVFAGNHPSNAVNQLHSGKGCPGWSAWYKR